MNFGRNVQSTLVMQVVIAVLALGLQVVLARWLTEPDRGLFAVVITFALLADYALQLGLRLAVIYRINRAGVARARALGAALWLALGALAFGLALAWLFGDALRARLLLGAPPAFSAVALTALELVGSLFEAVARAIDRSTCATAIRWRWARSRSRRSPSRSWAEARARSARSSPSRPCARSCSCCSRRWCCARPGSSCARTPASCAPRSASGCADTCSSCSRSCTSASTWCCSRCSPSTPRRSRSTPSRCR
jgi:hypothetical protein